MRAWLRAYATKHPCHGFRRAWAALRYDERREVNKKKIHRLWREEGLQVKVTVPRKRAGVSSIPPIEADAPNVVWAIDFQFDSTIDGKAIKIASMIDEHTRVLAAEHRRALDHRRAARRRAREGVRRGRRAAEGAADGQRTGVHFPSAATVLRRQGRHCPTFRRAARGTTATSNRSTTGYARSASTATIGTPCSRPAWSSATSSTSTTTDTATQPWATERRPSTLRPAGAPTPRWPARSTESGTKQPDSKSGWTQ